MITVFQRKNHSQKTSIQIIVNRKNIYIVLGSLFFDSVSSYTTLGELSFKRDKIDEK